MTQERTPLEMVAFAAWVNTPVDKVPEAYKQHTCEATMTAWRRVVRAILNKVEASTGHRYMGQIMAECDCPCQDVC